MKMIDGLNKVHIVGVGGCATSGLARILHARGCRVSGSDALDGSALVGLKGAGIDVSTGHGEDRVDGTVELVVRSAAVPVTNPEIQRAHALGIPVWKYAKVLGRLLEDSRGIAVAGTHGKTTCAGMLTSIFLRAGRDPSVLIGGHHGDLQGNWRQGSDPEFIVEACEYDRSFHCLHPCATLLTNLELDHPDVYSTTEQLTVAFQTFLDDAPDLELIIMNAEDAHLESIVPPSGARVVTFGLDEGTWRAEILAGGTRPRFEVRREGRLWGEVCLSVPGKHAVVNALGCLALAAEYGLDGDSIRAGLESFQGIARRFQERGRFHEIDLIDDYAHHPTEIRTTLETAREVYPSRKLRAVFQPHQFVRLAAFEAEFASALAQADRVGLCPVFTVRENLRDDDRGRLDRLAAAIEKMEVPVDQYSSLEDAEMRLVEEMSPREVCLTIGAGDISTLASGLQARLLSREKGLG